LGASFASSGCSAFEDPLPAENGGSGGGSAVTGGTPAAGGMNACETMALNKVFKDKCTTCHSNFLTPIGKPDLQTPGYTSLMLDQPASFYGVPLAQMGACPPGVLLINKSSPADSWFVKKLRDDVRGCGTIMPQVPQVLTGPERMEVAKYLQCVTGSATLLDLTPGVTSGGTGGTGTGGGGTGSGGTGGTSSAGGGAGGSAGGGGTGGT
jgi:hypothetical protein